MVRALALLPRVTAVVLCVSLLTGGALPGLRSAPIRTRSASTTVTRQFPAFFQTGASAGRSLGVTTWSLYAVGVPAPTVNSDPSVIIAVVGSNQYGSVVWEGDLQQDQYINLTTVRTTFGTNVTVQPNGAVLVAKSGANNDLNYINAAKMDMNAALGVGPTGPGRPGGPLPASRPRLRRPFSTFGLGSSIIGLLGAIGTVICYIAEPCGAGLTAALLLAGVAGSAGAVYDAIPSDEKLNFQTLTGTNVNQYGGVVFAGNSEIQSNPPGQITRVCTKDIYGGEMDCQYTFYPLG